MQQSIQTFAFSTNCFSTNCFTLSTNNLDRIKRATFEIEIALKKSVQAALSVVTSFIEMVLYHVVFLAYTSITFKIALKGAQFFYECPQPFLNS